MKSHDFINDVDDVFECAYRSTHCRPDASQIIQLSPFYFRKESTREIDIWSPEMMVLTVEKINTLSGWRCTWLRGREGPQRVRWKLQSVKWFFSQSHHCLWFRRMCAVTFRAVRLLCFALSPPITPVPPSNNNDGVTLEDVFERDKLERKTHVRGRCEQLSYDAQLQFCVAEMIGIFVAFF